MNGRYIKQVMLEDGYKQRGEDEMRGYRESVGSKRSIHTYENKK
jgi:hypothetical protein